ncbi:hypothetical protein Celaphus_00019614 [Cervus elaphus hippelaphus]|uniref:Uncharacterized protein n=1 Tax=Cervus elaphus hippelaphus TaxID=46360 RepID=A0A212BZ58_CEREH|nr:hypothetical protein Celaphus_00019614 [Cervus elaphus hippelaphus]
MEAVEEGVALQEGDVEGIGQDLHSPVEDIMEEVEVLVVKEEQELLSSQEWEENREEQNQGHPRLVVPRDWPPLPLHQTLEALAVLQVDLSCANEKYRRAYFRLRRKNHQRRMCLLSRRSAIMQGIPSFWHKVLSILLLLRSVVQEKIKNRRRLRGVGDGTGKTRGPK